MVAVGPDVELTDYYEQNANAFIATTRDVDMSGARGQFLAVMPLRQGSPARILDAGSGSGREAAVHGAVHEWPRCDNEPTLGMGAAARRGLIRPAHSCP